MICVSWYVSYRQGLANTHPYWERMKGQKYRKELIHCTFIIQVSSWWSSLGNLKATLCNLKKQHCYTMAAVQKLCFSLQYLKKWRSCGLMRRKTQEFFRIRRHVSGSFTWTYIVQFLSRQPSSDSERGVIGSVSCQGTTKITHNLFKGKVCCMILVTHCSSSVLFLGLDV